MVFYIMSSREYIMNNNNLFDVIVIGSGPSGIFTTIKLVDVGLKVALIDKSGNYYTRAKTMNKDLNGFGGAAMRYDANLDYSEGIPEKSNLGERVFGNRETAKTCIKEVYNRLESFGFNYKNGLRRMNNRNDYSSRLEIVDRGIVSIGEKDSTILLKNIYDYLMKKKLVFFEFTDVINITKNKIFEVETLNSQTGKKIRFKSSYVVLATGKLSTTQSIKIFDKLGIKYAHCDSIDIGVRIETRKESTDGITQKCVNPKIILENDETTTRTFCWCPGGRVIDYDFEGVRIIDGQHCHDNPTDQTNFGIVTTINLPEGVDGTKFGISYIRMFNELTGYKPGIQLFKDFVERKVSSKEAIKKNIITPTLLDYSLLDLNLIMIFNLRERILSLIEKVNETYPGVITRNALIYGPVLERIFPKVVLDFNMESSIKGFYVVGDISGKAIGVITGAAMGTKAASHIITSIGSK